MSSKRSSDKDRLSVIQRVIHQEAGRQPVEFKTVINGDLEGSGEYYKRRHRVNESFMRINAGWLADKAGTVLIQNLAGEFRYVRPTPEQVEAAERQVLEVAFIDSEYWFDIRPGDSLRINPSHIDKLSIRCREGETEFQLIVFPR